MSVRRPVYLAVLGWLAIVAVGSTMVWTVVAHAGRDVAATGPDTVSASSGPGATSGVGDPISASLSASPGQPSSSAASAATSSPSGAVEPDGSPSPTLGGEPGDDGTPGLPTADPTKTQPSTGSSPGGDPGNDSSPPSSSPPATQTQRGSWQGSAGTVVASCTDARISLVAAQPNSGWRVEVGDRGPEELSVHFELSEGDDDRESDDRTASRALGQEVEVHARCVGGAPSFTLGG